MKTPSLNEVITPEHPWVSWSVGFSRNHPKREARGAVRGRLERWLVIAVLLLLSGCSILEPVKDITVHHLLEPLVPDRSLSAATPAIAIGRPTLPSYLDRLQLVTRKEGQLMMSKVDVWAEPLDAAISRVLASNLSRLTGSMNIQPVGNFASMDYTELLELKIAQFEPDDGNQMILQGTWKMQPVSGKETSSHYFRIAMPMSAAALMKDRVSAMNEALVKLSREVVPK